MMTAQNFLNGKECRTFAISLCNACKMPDVKGRYKFKTLGVCRPSLNLPEAHGVKADTRMIKHSDCTWYTSASTIKRELDYFFSEHHTSPLKPLRTFTCKNHSQEANPIPAKLQWITPSHKKRPHWKDWELLKTQDKVTRGNSAATPIKNIFEKDLFEKTPCLKNIELFEFKIIEKSSVCYSGLPHEDDYGRAHD